MHATHHSDSERIAKQTCDRLDLGDAYRVRHIVIGQWCRFPALVWYIDAQAPVCSARAVVIGMLVTVSYETVKVMQTKSAVFAVLHTAIKHKFSRMSSGYANGIAGLKRTIQWVILHFIELKGFDLLGHNIPLGDYLDGVVVPLWL